jgi:hypothetical protein
MRLMTAAAILAMTSPAMAQYPYCPPGQRCSLNDVVRESQRQELEDAQRRMHGLGPAYRPAQPYQMPQQRPPQQRCYVQYGIQYCQ